MPSSMTRAISAASLVASIVAFAYLGELLFGAPLWGGVAGVLSGVGSYLLLPAFLASDGPESAPAAPLGLNRLAAGFALSSSAVTAFAVLFVFESVTPAAGPLAGLALAALEYPALARAFPEGSATFAAGG